MNLHNQIEQTDNEVIFLSWDRIQLVRVEVIEPIIRWQCGGNDGGGGGVGREEYLFW